MWVKFTFLLSPNFLEFFRLGIFSNFFRNKFSIFLAFFHEFSLVFYDFFACFDCGPRMEALIFPQFGVPKGSQSEFRVLVPVLFTNDNVPSQLPIFAVGACGKPWLRKQGKIGDDYFTRQQPNWPQFREKLSYDENVRAGIFSHFFPNLDEIQLGENWEKIRGKLFSQFFPQCFPNDFPQFFPNFFPNFFGNFFPIFSSIFRRISPQFFPNFSPIFSQSFPQFFPIFSQFFPQSFPNFSPIFPNCSKFPARV